MDRDPSIFRDGAMLLSRDFDRALPVPGGWRIDVSDDLVVTVSMGDRVEMLEFSDEVDDPDWFDVAETPAQRREALVAEASEALCDEMLEALPVWDVEPPRCAIHGARLGVCSGVWFCQKSHDVCDVGALTADDVAGS